MEFRRTVDRLDLKGWDFKCDNLLEENDGLVVFSFF